MTFVYAKCSAVERLELWDHLYCLARDMELPWLVGWDFNVLLHEDEKIGGLLGHPSEYEDFAFCINSCGLFDQGYKERPFTWCNARPNAQYYQCCKAIQIFEFLTKHDTFMDEVRQNWEANFIGDLFLMFKQKLKKVKAALSKWSRIIFGDIFKQLAMMEYIVRVKEMLFDDEPTIENINILLFEQML
uniref:Uncharacterized protein n=1 Tax=Nicotiana tabacum TaxID=4097 RepID=A0A1S4CQU4_TOBAC|nr:PREDICTED: uncharacterized protein LOC107821539 [Nicotiana tabacum]